MTDAHWWRWLPPQTRARAGGYERGSDALVLDIHGSARPLNRCFLSNLPLYTSRIRYTRPVAPVHSPGLCPNMPPKGPLPDILVSGRPSRSNYRVLTPRTPHSRAGRAEEGFTEVELENFDDDEAKEYRTQRQQQSQPLLSPNSRGPGYRSRGDDHELRGKEGFFRPASIWSKLPLLGGSLLAVVILGLFAVSIQRPGTLEKILLQSPEEFSDPSEPYIPANDHTARPIYTNAPLPSPSIVETRPPPSLLISYENYSSFPLTGDEYRHECAKIMGGFMHHGEYWEESHMGSPDVIHHDDATNYHLPEGERTRVCSSTITYLLDGHVGLLADLGLMAQAAAFAREVSVASRIVVPPADSTTLTSP